MNVMMMIIAFMVSHDLLKGNTGIPVPCSGSMKTLPLCCVASRYHVKLCVGFAFVFCNQFQTETPIPIDARYKHASMHYVAPSSACRLEFSHFWKAQESEFALQYHTLMRRRLSQPRPPRPPRFALHSVH